MTASLLGQNDPSGFIVCRGMCDASAGIALDSEHFVAASDEDNTLRVYSRRSGGAPIQELDLTAFLALPEKGREVDLEGAAQIGDTIFWISSHGRNKEGKVRKNRYRFFGVRIRRSGERWDWQGVGRPYSDLLTDLLDDPQLRRFDLAEAASRAPKEREALNIEGLCTTTNHHLLMGFRNPLPEGKALVVPLLNPSAVIEGSAARFGAPLLLDLKGDGVRDLARMGETYYIVAGAFDGRGRSTLYRWDGRSARPEPLASLSSGRTTLNPEALVVYPSETEGLQVLSDDGTKDVNGRPCKEVTDPQFRTFRAFWLSLRPGPGLPGTEK